MKKLIVSLMLIFIFLQPVSSYAQDKIIELIEAKFNAMNAHDINALERLYADSAKIESTGLNDPVYGPDQIAAIYSRYFSSTPDLKYKITRIVEGKNAAVVEYTSSGTFQNNEKKVPDYYREKKYLLKNIVRIDIDGNKIIGEYTYFDQVSFLKQMGFFDKKKNKN
jgi:steroid delta-isomerase-like uncharacterized protein